MQDANRNAPCRCGGRAGPGVVFAVLMIGIGTILLLDRFEILEARNIFHYWPAILVAIGLCNLLQPDGVGNRVGGAILTVVGGILLLSRLGLWYVGFRELWPLILIAVGLLMLWRAIEGPRAARRGAGSPSSTLNEFAIFGGVERRISSQEFEGGQACAVFGGVELDLRGAEMRGSQATIEANAVFGGVELRVPESWNVTIRGVGVFGGYSDQTRHPAPGVTPAKELIVRGVAVFGAVEIRN